MTLYIRPKSYFIFVTLFISFLFSSCGPLADANTYKRDEDFYTQFLNPPEKMQNIAKELNKAQILVTSDEYPLRMALFADGRFFYQVDQLGEGTGSWIYTDGTLKLNATRPIFDMKFTISGAQETGDDMVIRFFDRHGYNSIRIEAQGPQPTLPVYKFSDKGI